MSDWTSEKQIAVHIDYVEEANTVWNIIDPDVGGGNTFKNKATHSLDGSEPPTHSVTTSQLEKKTYDKLTTLGPYRIMTYMQELSDERDRSLPDWNSSKIENVLGAIEIDGNLKEVDNQYA